MVTSCNENSSSPSRNPASCQRTVGRDGHVWLERMGLRGAHQCLSDAQMDLHRAFLWLEGRTYLDHLAAGRHRIPVACGQGCGQFMGRLFRVSLVKHTASETSSDSRLYRLPLPDIKILNFNRRVPSFLEHLI